jgi:hypothetical protein
LPLLDWLQQFITLGSGFDRLRDVGAALIVGTGRRFGVRNISTSIGDLKVIAILWPKIAGMVILVIGFGRKGLGA